MNVKDLYFDVLCENEDIDIIDKIVLAIKKMASISVSFHLVIFPHSVSYIGQFPVSRHLF